MIADNLIRLGNLLLAQPFSAGVARAGGSMNNQLHRGVPKRAQPKPSRQANDAEIRLLQDRIGADSSF